MIDKNQITEGDYIFLTDSTYCRVEKSWHGKDNVWLVVTYSKKDHLRQTRVPVTRSVELHEIREKAPKPFTDPK